MFAMHYIPEALLTMGDPQAWVRAGASSLSTVGDKCAKDNFWGFVKSLTNFGIQKSI